MSKRASHHAAQVAEELDFDPASFNAARQEDSNAALTARGSVISQHRGSSFLGQPQLLPQSRASAAGAEELEIQSSLSFNALRQNDANADVTARGSVLSQGRGGSFINPSSSVPHDATARGASFSGLVPESSSSAEPRSLGPSTSGRGGSTRGSNMSASGGRGSQVDPKRGSSARNSKIRDLIQKHVRDDSAGDSGGGDASDSLPRKSQEIRQLLNLQDSRIDPIIEATSPSNSTPLHVKRGSEKRGSLGDKLRKRTSTHSTGEGQEAEKEERRQSKRGSRKASHPGRKKSELDPINAAAAQAEAQAHRASAEQLSPDSPGIGNIFSTVRKSQELEETPSSLLPSQEQQQRSSTSGEVFNSLRVSVSADDQDPTSSISGGGGGAPAAPSDSGRPSASMLNVPTTIAVTKISGSSEEPLARSSVGSIPCSVASAQSSVAQSVGSMSSSVKSRVTSAQSMVKFPSDLPDNEGSSTAGGRQSTSTRASMQRNNTAPEQQRKKSAGFLSKLGLGGQSRPSMGRASMMSRASMTSEAKDLFEFVDDLDLENPQARHSGSGFWEPEDEAESKAVTFRISGTLNSVRQMLTRSKTEPGRGKWFKGGSSTDSMSSVASGASSQGGSPKSSKSAKAALFRFAKSYNPTIIKTDEVDRIWGKKMVDMRLEDLTSKIVRGHDDASAMQTMLRDSRVDFNYFDLFETDVDTYPNTIRVFSKFAHALQIAMIMVASASVFCFMFPDQAYIRSAPLHWVSMGIVLDGLYAFGLLLQLRTSLLDHERGIEMCDPKYIRAQAFSSWTFWLDIFTLVPWYFFIVGNSSTSTTAVPDEDGWFTTTTGSSVLIGWDRVFGWLCYCKTSRIWRVFVLPTRFKFVTSGFYSITRMILIIFLVGHCVGILWHAIVTNMGTTSMHHLNADSYTNLFDDYWMAFNQGIYILLAVDREAMSPVENFFLGFSIPFAAVFHAVIFGEIIMLIQRREALETKHQEHNAAVNQAMRSLGLAPDLQLRIITYFTYERLHRSHIGFNALFNRLSPQLRFELHLYLYAELVVNTPLFKSTHPRVLREIVVALKDLIYLPGDFVCRHGEFGDSMYFIMKGTTMVLAPDCETVLAQLKEGSYFGETSLLTGVKRTAFVRAQTFCVLAILEHDDLAPIIMKWPEQIEVLTRSIANPQDRVKVEEAARTLYGLAPIHVTQEREAPAYMQQNVQNARPGKISRANSSSLLLPQPRSRQASFIQPSNSRRGSLNQNQIVPMPMPGVANTNLRRGSVQASLGGAGTLGINTGGRRGSFANHGAGTRGSFARQGNMGMMGLAGLPGVNIPGSGIASAQASRRGSALDPAPAPGGANSLRMLGQRSSTVDNNNMPSGISNTLQAVGGGSKSAGLISSKQHLSDDGQSQLVTTLQDLMSGSDPDSPGLTKTAVKFNAGETPRAKLPDTKRDGTKRTLLTRGMSNKTLKDGDVDAVLGVLPEGGSSHGSSPKSGGSPKSNRGGEPPNNEIDDDADRKNAAVDDVDNAPEAHHPQREEVDDQLQGEEGEGGSQHVVVDVAPDATAADAPQQPPRAPQMEAGPDAGAGGFMPPPPPEPQQQQQQQPASSVAARTAADLAQNLLVAEQSGDGPAKSEGDNSGAVDFPSPGSPQHDSGAADAVPAQQAQQNKNNSIIRQESPKYSSKDSKGSTNSLKEVKVVAPIMSPKTSGGVLKNKKKIGINGLLDIDVSANVATVADEGSSQNVRELRNALKDAASEIKARESMTFSVPSSIQTRSVATKTTRESLPILENSDEVARKSTQNVDQGASSVEYVPPRAAGEAGELVQVSELKIQGGLMQPSMSLTKSEIAAATGTNAKKKKKKSKDPDGNRAESPLDMDYMGSLLQPADTNNNTMQPPVDLSPRGGSQSLRPSGSQRPKSVDPKKFFTPTMASVRASVGGDGGFFSGLKNRFGRRGSTGSTAVQANSAPPVGREGLGHRRRSSEADIQKTLQMGSRKVITERKSVPNLGFGGISSDDDSSDESIEMVPVVQSSPSSTNNLRPSVDSRPRSTSPRPPSPRGAASPMPPIKDDREFVIDGSAFQPRDQKVSVAAAAANRGKYESAQRMSFKRSQTSGSEINAAFRHSSSGGEADHHLRSSESSRSLGGRKSDRKSAGTLLARDTSVQSGSGAPKGLRDMARDLTWGSSSGDLRGGPSPVPPSPMANKTAALSTLRQSVSNLDFTKIFGGSSKNKVQNLQPLREAVAEVDVKKLQHLSDGFGKKMRSLFKEVQRVQDKNVRVVRNMSKTLMNHQRASTILPPDCNLENLQTLKNMNKAAVIIKRNAADLRQAQTELQK